jgi:hypothetical protein
MIAAKAIPAGGQTSAVLSDKNDASFPSIPPRK